VEGSARCGGGAGGGGGGFLNVEGQSGGGGFYNWNSVRGHGGLLEGTRHVCLLCTRDTYS